MRSLQVVAVATSLLIIAYCAPVIEEQKYPPASTLNGPAAVSRPIVIVSDLHMGIGKTAGQWEKLEDFRWHNALRGFLAMISQRYGDGIDLVVAGDLLELWQHPDVSCDGCNANMDLGCSVVEVERVASRVLNAHAADLRLLGEFADRGTNRVFVIPGNHDAALLLDSIWGWTRKAIGSRTGRVFRPENGVWVSDNGFVVVEHGHQIDYHVNRLDKWPVITGRCSSDDKIYVERPWGELFVQNLFNDKETIYPIIDNLMPESAGADLYIRTQGLIGSGLDLARFIAFNVSQTSLRQKMALDASDPNKADAWNVAAARSRGHRLFADTLMSDDPLRVQLLEARDQRALEIKKALDDLAGNRTELPDEAVLALCDMIKIRSQRDPNATVQLCTRDLLIGTARSILPLSRILAPHLKTRLEGYSTMRIFIYGHTHQADFDISVKPTPARTITVLNAGAFQRLTDRDRLMELAHNRNITPEKAFETLTLEDLPACYSAIMVAYDPDGIPEPELKSWHMPETGMTGELLDPCDPRCGARPPRCRAQ